VNKMRPVESSALILFLEHPPRSGLWKMRLLRILLFFLVSTSFAATGLAQEDRQPINQLYHTTWSASQGVTGAVIALAQTSDGYLWVGTTDGLFRFDGMSVERYQPENGSLPSNSVSTLFAAPGGGLWVGFSRGGVSFIKDGKITNYAERDGLPVSRVRCLAQDPSGTVWAAIVGGLARLEGQRWHQVRGDWNYPSKSAWALMVDRDGTLWVAAIDRMMFLPQGERQFHDTGIRSGRVAALAQAPDGSIIFYDDNRELTRSFLRDADGRIEPLPDLDIPARAIAFDRSGAIWLGGIGLTRWQYTRLPRHSKSEAGWETYTDAQGLTDNAVRALLKDREGNIWVGTDSGLERFRHRNLFWFPLKGRNFSMVPDDYGQVWAGSFADKPYPVTRIQDGKMARDGPTHVFTTYRDPDGTIWFSGKDSLLHWDHGRFTKIDPPDQAIKLSLSATPRDPIIVSAITKDRSGNLWVAFGGSGEFCLKDGVWRFVEVLSKHPDWAANFAFTDFADRIWLSYGTVVAAFDHGKIRSFTSEDGLSVGPSNFITGAGEEIWIAGESGVAFLRGDRFHTLQSTDGAGFRSIAGLVAQPGGGLWLSADLGIVHIPESEIQLAFEHPEHKVSYELFDLVSDLPEPLQHTSVYASGSIQDGDGMLWFATRSGAARLDPAHIYRNPLPPQVAIRSVIADERSFSAFSILKFPALTRNIEIDYTALSLSIPERVRFRYKLEGRDSEWHDAGTRRQTFYTDLGPGKYIFHVMASNNDGVWNEEGATLRFSVAPAWFQTKWFQMFCIAIGLFAVWLLHRWRLRRVATVMSERFDERLAERTRIARDLHDTFLQTVQGSKLVADDALEQASDTGRMRRALEQLSIWLGQATLEGRAALNSLRTTTIVKNELAPALRRAAESGFVAGAIHVTVSVIGEAREMHPIVRDEVYRIGYEAIRNAQSHSGGSRLEVELRYGQDLTLRIRDNGIGIDQALLHHGKDGHFGLQGMRERAARIRGTFKVESSRASGTEVSLVLPGDVCFLHPRATISSRVRELYWLIVRRGRPRQ
jgi:signal transduction histidine kinase/ligand-binding sensor domain-containing protein